MRAVGAFCVGAVTLPLTARIDLAIWEMVPAAVLVGLGFIFTDSKDASEPVNSCVASRYDATPFSRCRACGYAADNFTKTLLVLRRVRCGHGISEAYGRDRPGRPDARLFAATTPVAWMRER
jgi:hypothetical protein